MPKSLEQRRYIAALGGFWRAKKLSPERRREIAQAGYKAMKKKLAEQAAQQAQNAAETDTAA